MENGGLNTLNRPAVGWLYLAFMPSLAFDNLSVSSVLVGGCLSPLCVLPFA
jgi:hypothetical protein